MISGPTGWAFTVAYGSALAAGITAGRYGLVPFAARLYRILRRR